MGHSFFGDTVNKAMNFGKNFFLIFLPFHILGLIGINYVNEYTVELILFFLLFGVIGNGIGGHRYFAHGQFEVIAPIKWILGFVTTLGAIGPLHYWIIQHKTHHLLSDTESDPHSPAHGVWHTFYSWTFSQGSNEHLYMKERFAKKIAVRLAKDNFYKFFSNYHYLIIYLFCFILFLIDYRLLFIYSLSYVIDFFKLGLVNYFCHRSGYRNHNTKDSSTNNFLLGYLTFGFGWHNNHHANPGKLILTEKWWELDIEGYIGFLISKMKISFNK